MNTKKKIIIFSSIAFVGIIGIVLYIRAHNDGPRIINSDTTIRGDYHVEPEDWVILENNATLTVTGDLTIDGVLSCSKGKLSLVVLGALHVNKRVECVLEDVSTDPSGVSIAIAAKHLEWSAQSVLDTNGHIDIASDVGRLVASTAERKKYYDSVLENAGDTPRIGPFIEGDTVQKISELDITETLPDASVDSALPSLIIRGVWHVGDGGQLQSGVILPPPPLGNENILIRFDYGNEGVITLEQFHLFGPNGHDGKDDTGVSCDARGENGGDAFRFLVNAKKIILNEFVLALGGGGAGGNATTKTDCVDARATGGNGGGAGNLNISATEKIYVVDLTINPGAGGDGGSATAIGKNGDNACPGTAGGNAVAHAGNGNTNKKDLKPVGIISGIGKITVGRIEGGSGGDATAQPGRGGDGNGCNCTGGHGGNSEAVAGYGADAFGTLPSGTIEAHGGDGGDARTTGGTGGNGGNCEMKPTGGNGGTGGDAKAMAGKGGNGKTANGYDGKIINASGGTGGAGGSGCGPGAGGGAGLGNPLGINGASGTISCPPGQTFTGAPVQTVSVPQQETPLIKAILFHGKYLPTDQLYVNNKGACGKEHWRAENGSVRATDGTDVIDPASAPCGYGKITENPVIMVPEKPYIIR